MKIRYLLLFAFTVFTNCLFAQKDTTIFYMTAAGRPVPVKGFGDMYIKIYPPEPGGNPKLFVVEGYSNDGRKLFQGYSLTAKLPLKLQGHYITYSTNGNKIAQRNYDDCEIMGEQILYYPNGKFYTKISKEIGMTDTTVFYKECRDSTGNILAENGNGRWVEYNDDFSWAMDSGSILNGLKDGAWIFTSEDGGYTDTTIYKDGKAINNAANKIWSSVQSVPEFPGGLDAFNKFLSRNIKYPAYAKKNNIQGRVIITYVVERNGTLHDIKVTSGIGGGCDEEAVRVIKLSPPWKPGVQNGAPVRIRYSVPINFTLNRN
jgi:TonB family protein